MKKRVSTVSALALAVLLAPAGAAFGQLKVVAYNTYHKPTSPSNYNYTTILGNMASVVWHNSYYGVGQYETIPQRPAVLALTEVGTSREGEPPTGAYIQQICNNLWSSQGANYGITQIHAGSYEDYAFVYDQSQVQLLEVMTVTAGYRPAYRALFQPVGYTSTASQFYIYNVHLKAYSGEEGTRAGEVASFVYRAAGAAQSLPADANIMYMGDFNFTTSHGEPGYDILLDPSIAQHAVATDPIGDMIDTVYPGTARYGSTRIASAVCTYSSSSPWSRIDLIFLTTELTDGEGLDIVPDTLHAHGNNNGSVRLYSALAGASDHIPVIGDLQLPAKMAVQLPDLDGSTIIANPTAGIEVLVENVAPVVDPRGADELDYVVSGSGAVDGAAAGTADPLAGPNAHTLAFDDSLLGPQSGTITVSSASPAVENGEFTAQFDVTLLAPAQPSLAGDSVVLSQSIDLGAYVPGHGVQTVNFSIHNLASNPTWSADLDIDGVIGAGDTGVLYTNATSGVIAAGASESFVATFDADGAQGPFSAIWTIQISDEDGIGAVNRTLQLTLTGYIAVDGDVDLDGDVDFDDFTTVGNNYGQTSGMTWRDGDFDGDGDVDFEDFSAVGNAYGS